VPQQSPISFPLGTKNVLIIDGNDAMQTLRAGVLRSRGVHVHTAKSVTEAELLWVPDFFDLVLLDARQRSNEAVEFWRTIRRQYLCAKIGEVPEAKTPGLKGTDGKNRLIGALKASFDFCGTALRQGGRFQTWDTVELFGGREGLRAFALIALTNDWADHYCAAAMYLRLNGLLPPTAQEKK
jgi:CheY-like chemotaxis protein